MLYYKSKENHTIHMKENQMKLKMKLPRVKAAHNNLRKYQNKYIVNPILKEIRKNQLDGEVIGEVHAQNMVTLQNIKKINVITSGTGSGKTHTLLNVVIPTIFKDDLADIVIFTCPNDAALVDAGEQVSKWVDDKDALIVDKSFTGAAYNKRTFTAGPTILIVHPTAISTNADLFAELGESQRIVIVCDEGHIGLQCRDAEEATEGMGYRHADPYPGEWINSILKIPFVACFTFSATPRITVANSDWQKLFSTCPKEETLDYHGVNRGVVFYDLVDYEKTVEKMVEENAREHEEMKDIHVKYGLPISKPIIGIQGTPENVNFGAASSLTIWKHLTGRKNKYGLAKGSVAIAISSDKEVSGFTMSETAREFGTDGKTKAIDIFDGVSDKTKSPYILIATKLLDNAVNIPSIKILMSTQTRSSIIDLNVTAGVEQFCGRANRFPTVEGISNIKEAVARKLKAIKDGVPKEIAEYWFKVTFGYTLVLPDSPQNRAGIKAFFENQTINADEWNERLNKIEYDLRSKGQKQWSGIKSPWAQPGDLSYKNEKGCLCEKCPRDENGVPQCAATFHALGYTEEEYRESLDVNHKNGDHTDNRPENLETLCANMHRAITKREKHSTNLKYRDNVVGIA